jgi:AraC-like DNA-binding protein
MLGCLPRLVDDAVPASPYIQFIFPPPTLLADYVASFWVLLSRPNLPAPVLEHAFPSLGVKLIVNLGAPVRSASTALEPGSAFAIAPRAYLLGARTTSVDLMLARSTRLIGVQFTPAGAYRFLQASLHEMTNRGVALDMAWPGIIALDERLAAAATMQQQVLLLAQFLTKQLERRPDRQSATHHVIELLHTTASHQSIDQIAASLGISRRHLARLFLTEVGMPPKLCARILRFQQALRQLTQYLHTPAAHIAALGGYADQSHFIREFRSFAGLSPNAYRRQAQRVPNIQYIHVRMCYSGSGAGTIIG